MKCFSCPNEFHPATGGLHSYPHPDGTTHTVAFCGVCERDLADWLWRHTRSRIRRTSQDGKTVILRFYDHASPPPDGEKEGK